MMVFVAYALLAGIFVGLSRQVNGRLSLSTSAMESSFWNHIVGLAFMTVAALFIGGLFAGTPQDTPWWAYFRRTRWCSLYRDRQLADRPDRGSANSIVNYRRSDDFRCGTGYHLGERRQFHSTYIGNRIDHRRNVGRPTQEYSIVAARHGHIYVARSRSLSLIHI